MLELVDDDDDEDKAMLAELGVEEPGMELLARVGIDTLGV